MRILMVCNVDWFLLSHRRHLLRHLVERGDDVTVACADTGRLSEIEQIGVTTIEVGFSRSGSRILSEIRTLVALARVIRSSRPDVIHNVTIKPILYGTFLARLLTRGPRIVNAISGFGYAFTEAASAVTRGLTRIAYAGLMRSKRVVMVVQNDSARALLLSAGITKPDRVTVIEGSGIDCEEFSPATRRSASSFPRVLMASRILRDKGVVEYVEAIRSLQRRGVAVDALLTGAFDVGGNPTALTEPELASLLSGSGVSYLGETSDMAGLMREVDVLVLPSHHEGLPQVLLEGAAAGLTLVASDIAGCRSIVIDGVTGRLTTPRSIDDLAHVLEEVAGDAAARARYGTASRLLALERFDRRVVLGHYDRLYASLGRGAHDS
jgi:glycosyltransferase involved in cell wall biosynthesis